eukprot:231815_1
MDPLWNSINLTIQHVSQLMTQYPRISKYSKYIGLLFAMFGTRYVLLKTYYKIRKYPPGPIGLPFFGSFMFYVSKPKECLSYFATYGQITTVSLMQSTNIFINDAKLAKRILKDKQLANHWENHNRFREIGGFDILNGSQWWDRRKYVLKTLFSITSSSFTLQHISGSIQKYFDQYPSDYDQQFKTRQFSAFVAFNNVFSAIYGVNLEMNDPLIGDYVAATSKKFSSIGTLILIDLSFGIKIPDFLMWNVISDHRKNEKLLDDVLISWMVNNGYKVSLNENIIDTSIPNKNRVFINMFIEKLKANKVTANQIISDIGMLLTAAIDTTSASSEYGMTLLAKYPNIQQEIYEEIVDVMKKNNFKEFNFNILNELHKFKAFIHEMLRISCVAGSGVPHQIYENYTVTLDDGTKYILPKGSLINYNSYFIMKKKSWLQSGEIFDGEGDNDIHLEYWLNKDKQFEMNDNFILFGSGSRDCVGQQLAKNAIYAMFGILLSKYKLIAPNNDTNSINIKQKWGLVQIIDPQIPLTIQKR